MADRGILFSAPMVRALLSGVKTQTRRTINFQGVEKVEEFLHVATEKATGRRVYEMRGKGGEIVHRPAGKGLLDPHYKAPHAVGDRLYVRETFSDRRPGQMDRSLVWYFADSPWRFEDRIPWKPSLHMPRWASRITLTVTEIRIERLHMISDADAIAEGIEKIFYEGNDPQFVGDWAWKDYEDHPHAIAGFRKDSPKSSYRSLWGSINGAASWANNPWVTVTTFKPVEMNIDMVKDGEAA